MVTPPKRITILGGTGTLGQELTRSILDNWQRSYVTIVSRGEHKQAEMKRRFPQINYRIGDIRDDTSIAPHIKGADLVIHCAALKHVDICEANFLECKKTNLDGTINIANLSIRHGVKNVIFSTTDKAVEPVNTYGHCKLLAEKYLYDLNISQLTTRFAVYRWGNVLGSQGSAIHTFAQSLLKNQTVDVTDPKMTRFWIPIEWATVYMLRTFHQADLCSAMIPPNMKAANIMSVIAAVADVLNIKGYRTIEKGPRPGEKIHESMAPGLTSELAEKYTKGELIEMLLPVLKPYMEKQ